MLQWKSFVTWQIVFLKIKIKLVSITATANCNEHEFYDLMMQCLLCLRNAYNRITLLICCKWLAAKRFHIYHYPYIFFSRCHVRNLVWNWYGSMEDRLPFYFWNLPFHFILASSIFHTEISLPFHFPFHSIPWFWDLNGAASSFVPHQQLSEPVNWDDSIHTSYRNNTTHDRIFQPHGLCPPFCGFSNDLFGLIFKVFWKEPWQPFQSIWG